jgi:hypothetical protein
VVLRELATVFLKLGATALGAPAVRIALLDNEVAHLDCVAPGYGLASRSKST